MAAFIARDDDAGGATMKSCMRCPVADNRELWGTQLRMVGGAISGPHIGLPSILWISTSGQKLPFKPRPSWFRFLGQSDRKLPKLLLSVTLRTSLRLVRCVENLPKAAVAFQFDRTSAPAQLRPFAAFVTLARCGPRPRSA